MRLGAGPRIRGLVLKDIAELWRNPGVVVPAVAVALASLVPAFLVAFIAPLVSGEPLADADEFAEAARAAEALLPEIVRLEGNARVQAFVFHQFALLLLLVPVVGAMAMAAHAVIGEKLARTLEPLLATPLSAAELLAAKTLTPLAFSVVLMWTTAAVYVGAIAGLAEAGVWRTFVGVRTALLFAVIGPLAALLALLTAVIVSSRVNDARSAQQLGALVVLPITIAFVGQLVGWLVVDARVLVLAALGLVVLDALLLWVGVLVFDRERILTGWR
jgi:ABC-2 type transport system permease protein